MVDAEFAERGLPLKPGAAADIVAERAEVVADRLRITPRTALNYLSEDAIRDLVRSTAGTLRSVKPLRTPGRRCGWIRGRPGWWSRRSRWRLGWVW